MPSAVVKPVAPAAVVAKPVAPPVVAKPVTPPVAAKPIAPLVAKPITPPVAKPITPVAAKPAAKPQDPDEPPPLDAAPLPAALEEDPLIHLFDGEMELPEEAGEALGSLLGDRAPAQEETHHHEPEERVLVVDGTGETRTADARELAALLDVEVDIAVSDPGEPVKPAESHLDAGAAAAAAQARRQRGRSAAGRRRWAGAPRR